MLAGLQHHLGGPDHGLGGVLHRVGPGQAAGHAAVGHGVQHQVEVGGAAAGDGGAHVHQGLLNPVEFPCLVHDAQEAFQLFLGHLGAGLVKNHALAHSHGGVGHNADDGAVCRCHLLKLGDGEPCRHGHQHGLFRPGGQGGADGLQHPAHQVGLDPQEEVAAFLGGLLVGPGGKAQILGQDLGLFQAAVRQNAVGEGLAHSPGDGASHVAGADEAKGIFHGNHSCSL